MVPLISDQLNYIKLKFPKAVILCTTGNNDAVFYYQAPPTAEIKKQFYGDLYQMWFAGPDAPIPNQQYANQPGLKDTMMDGGYFRVDNLGGANSKLSVISLSTIYYHRLNQYDPETGMKQLAWLNTQLSSAPAGSKFILMMHIFPGLFYLDKIEYFWTESSLTEFNNIIARNSDKILFITGAHIHFADIRAPVMGGGGADPKAIYLITPSVSPIFKNNPGYSILDL